MTGNRYDWDAIRAQNPIEDVIGRIIPLKKANAHELKGLCPFHNERTPSFHVVPGKGFYHCFGCGAHGDVIDFVAKTQNVSALDALDLLTRGDAAGVKMTAAENAAREKLVAERDAAQARERAAATAKAQARWDAADECEGPEHNAYLAKKGVDAHSCRREGDCLLLPIYDAEGEIMSVQSIAPDSSKKFQRGAPTKGGRMWIGIHLGRTVICEGYATGASIHEATADQVCVAFSKSNMAHVARDLAEAGMSIALAADTNAADEMTALAKELDCPVIIPTVEKDFNDQAAAQGHASVAGTFAKALRAYADEKRRATEEAKADAQPVDLWAKHEAPAFRSGLLPPIIETFAKVRGEQMGVDPGGLAMSALTACAAVIRDSIKIKVKQHERWTESARIWVMLIGDPSYKKSPIMRAATGKIKMLDADMLYAGNKALADWQEGGGSKSGQAQPQTPRLRVEDITMEAAQEVCKHSPEGILCLQDELSGWFGGIEKYSGGKGAAKDRSFWLTAFGGGQYAVNRVGRGSYLIDNLSVSILGGVQPDPIRRIVGEATDDGLIQRFFPIILQPANVGRDEEMQDIAFEYEAMVERLHNLKPPEGVMGPLNLFFDDGARRIREQLEAKHHKLVTSTEGFNKKLAAHIGKFDGLFPRLCIIWHCIEHAMTPAAINGPAPLPLEVTEATARRVADFLHGYILRHSLAFYAGVVGLAEDHDQLLEVAGYILAKRLDTITMRTLARGSRTMRRLTREEGARIFEQLEAFGWLEQVHKRTDAPHWNVNKEVHVLFEKKAIDERRRRDEARLAVLDMLAD